MRDLLASLLMVTTLSMPLAGLAQECPSDASSDHRAVAAVATTVDSAVAAIANESPSPSGSGAPSHHHWWDTVLSVADNVAAVGSLAVGIAALAGVSAPIIPIAAAVLGGYFVVRGGMDLLSMYRHHHSLNPLHSAEARGDYLSVAAGVFDIGSLTIGARMIGGIRAETGLGVAGAVAGFATVPDAAISMVKDWRHMDNYQRGLAVAQIGLAAATAGHARNDAAEVAKKVAPVATHALPGVRHMAPPVAP